MITTRRKTLLALAGGVAAATLAAPVRAQPFPGVARILCGFPAGGTADVTSRLVAEAWRTKLAENVIVENRVGAGGRLAVNGLKEAAADGRTLLLTPDSVFTIYNSVYRRLGYDPALDFTPVSPVCTFAFALGVGPGVPETVRTLGEFVTWVKADPGRAQFAVPAAGSAPHFLGDVFYRAIGVTPSHVPYRGSAPAIQDLVGGHIPACVTVLGDFLPQRTQPGLRMLAVSSAARSRFMPDVPTFTELGYPQVTGIENYGFFLPSRTPSAIVEAVARLVREAVAVPAVAEGLARIGMEQAADTPQAYAGFLDKERVQWRPIVTASGFTLEE
jgi:tripartite-type tricarboxylate transporter receptor subunit TctC